jgi:hypothetical protein
MAETPGDAHEPDGPLGWGEDSVPRLDLTTALGERGGGAEALTVARAAEELRAEKNGR